MTTGLRGDPRRGPTTSTTGTPARYRDLVTVMIPARNEEGAIGACLESVLAQDYPNLQIVVVDSNSTDGTARIIASLRDRDPRIEVVCNERRSIPAALNAGLAAARGRWLVRVDAHSTVPPGYVSRAVDRLAEGRWGGVGGRKNGHGSTATGRAIAAAMGSRFGVGNSTYHHGTCEREVDHVPFGAYPVELVRDLRGWDERLLANEDYEFDYRLRQTGRSLLFDPALVIHWDNRQTVPDLFRQYFRYGRGKADVAALHPTSLQLRHALPPVFVAYGAVSALVALRRPATAVLMISPYAVSVLAASMSAGRHLGSVGERIRVPLAFVAMHVGWGAGFWAGAREAVGLRSTPYGAAPPSGSQR